MMNTLDIVKWIMSKEGTINMIVWLSWQMLALITKRQMVYGHEELKAISDKQKWVHKLDYDEINESVYEECDDIDNEIKVE